MSNPWDAFQQGMMTGQQFGQGLRQRRNTRELGSMLQSGDYSGAAGAAFGQGDLQTGIALQGQAAQQAGKQRQGQIVGAVREGRYEEARGFAQSPEELAQIDEFKSNATEQERAEASQRFGLIAAAIESVQSLPPEQQGAAAQERARQLGLDPSTLPPDTWTPQGLEAARIQTLGYAKYLEFKQDEREASQWRFVPQLGGFLPPTGFQPPAQQGGGAQVLGNSLPPGWTPQPRPNQPSPASAAGGGERSQTPRVSFRSSQEAQSAIQQIVPGVRVTSGARDAASNRRVGGAPGSFHLQDRARDLVPPPGMSMGDLAAKMRQAGFRVLNEGDHIHVSW